MNPSEQDPLPIVTILNSSKIGLTPEHPQTLESDELVSSTLSEERATTTESVEAVLEENTKVPASVRIEVDELFTKLKASKDQCLLTKQQWSKSAEDKKNLVRVASLLCEYSWQVPEFSAKTGIPGLSSVRKYLKKNPSLSEVEMKVIDILQGGIITINTDREEKKPIDRTQKAYLYVLTNLLRKQELGNNAAHAALNTYGVTQVNLKWQWAANNFYDEHGVPNETNEELLSDLYERAKAELENPSVDREHADVNEVDEAIDTNILEPEADHGNDAQESTPDDVEATMDDHDKNLRQGVEATEVKNEMTVDTIISQNRAAISIIQESENGSPESLAASHLLSMNVTILNNILTDLGHSPALNPLPEPAVRITGNEFALSPATMQKIEDGSVEVKVTIDERTGLPFTVIEMTKSK